MTLLNSYSLDAATSWYGAGEGGMNIFKNEYSHSDS